MEGDFDPMGKPPWNQHLQGFPAMACPLNNWLFHSSSSSMEPATAEKDARRKFLIFDQSGDQTRLVYGSSANLVKPSATSHNPTPVLRDERVEMHEEDSDELDALLYSSDSDSDSSDDEVTSTGHSPEVDGPAKRRKLSEGRYVATMEDDAESSVGNTDGGRKRWRKEKIRETLSVLQKIVPGGKGKCAMGVIDETIRYLKSLKVEAESLRLDCL